MLLASPTAQRSQQIELLIQQIQLTLVLILSICQLRQLLALIPQMNNQLIILIIRESQQDVPQAIVIKIREDDLLMRVDFLPAAIGYQPME